jgi:hypothetical protein
VPLKRPFGWHASLSTIGRIPWLARYRLIDTAGSEFGIVSYAVPNMSAGDTVHLPDGRGVTVVEVYDDEDGQEGDVSATLVVQS